jgi:cytochrome c-type biogenesis protein CcmH
MLQSGSTDDQIRSFLVDRYGDFVLYRPPLKANTMALWAVPVLLLCVGAVIVLIAVRRQKRQPLSEETEREA